MSVEQICELIKKIPIPTWERIPSPRNEIEPSTERGSGKVVYIAKYKGLRIEASDSFDWTTSYTEESDFWPAHSQRNFSHIYKIKVSEGYKTRRVSEEDRWGTSPLGKLFEGYFEERVKSHIRDKEIVKERAEEENLARRKRHNERSLLAMFTKS